MGEACANQKRTVELRDQIHGASQMPDPMQPIYDAKEAIDTRNKQRQHLQMDFRGAAAAEVIADELTMMRAEMTVMRGLLAQIALRR
jgi:hypothetical protein